MANVASPKTVFPCTLPYGTSSLERSIDEYLLSTILHLGVSRNAGMFITNVLFISAYIRSVPQCNVHSALSNSTQMLTEYFQLGE